jgi:hypothetical protein
MSRVFELTFINYCPENHHHNVTTHVISAAMFLITHSVQRRIRWADRYGRTGKNSHLIVAYFEGISRYLPRPTDKTAPKTFIITPTCLNIHHVTKVVHLTSTFVIKHYSPFNTINTGLYNTPRISL